MCEAKISFGFSPKIIIDGISIPLINEDRSRVRNDSLSHKASSTKNNLSKSMECKPGLA